MLQTNIYNIIYLLLLDINEPQKQKALCGNNQAMINIIALFLYQSAKVSAEDIYCRHCEKTDSVALMTG